MKVSTFRPANWLLEWLTDWLSEWLTDGCRCQQKLPKTVNGTKLVAIDVFGKLLKRNAIELFETDRLTGSSFDWADWQFPRRTEVGVKCRGSFLVLHQLLSKCPPDRWSYKSDKRTRDKYFSSLLAFLHFGGPLWPNQSDFCLMLPTTQLFL